MNANIVIPNTTNLRLVIIDGHVTTDPKEPMLSQTSYPIIGWRLVENDLVPLLPRLVHLVADIDPDESGGVIRWSYLHDLVTGGLYDAHTGSSLGETLDEAMESAELLLFGLSESSQPS
jgi:hypothetical protein